jgi:hypothetical protein
MNCDNILVLAQKDKDYRALSHRDECTDNCSIGTSISEDDAAASCGTVGYTPRSSFSNLFNCSKCHMMKEKGPSKSMLCTVCKEIICMECLLDIGRQECPYCLDNICERDITDKDILSFLIQASGLHKDNLKGTLLDNLKNISPHDLMSTGLPMQEAFKIAMGEKINFTMNGD